MNISVTMVDRASQRQLAISVNVHSHLLVATVKHWLRHQHLDHFAHVWSVLVQHQSLLWSILVSQILATTVEDVPSFTISLVAIARQLSLVTIVNSVSCLVLFFSHNTWKETQLSMSYHFDLARKRAMSYAPCANVTCHNGGECVVSEKGPQCSCPTPYYGDRCEMSKSILKERNKYFVNQWSSNFSQSTTNMQPKSMR